MESVISLHFGNNATSDTKNFSITMNEIKKGFAEIFELFETNTITLAFIVKTSNTNMNEINNLE